MIGQPTDWKGHHVTMKCLCYFSFLVKDLTLHELTSCNKDKQIIRFIIPVVSYKLCWFYQLSNTIIWW